MSSIAVTDCGNLWICFLFGRLEVSFNVLCLLFIILWIISLQLFLLVPLMILMIPIRINFIFLIIIIIFTIISKLIKLTSLAVLHSILEIMRQRIQQNMMHRLRVIDNRWKHQRLFFFLFLFSNLNKSSFSLEFLLDVFEFLQQFWELRRLIC